MSIESIGPGKKAPETINVIIENPRGGNNKYEFDKETGFIKLDRVMYSAVFFPADYGFVPQTLCEDGDPLDIFVLTTNPIHPGVLVEVRPIGVIDMVDSGEQDNKLLGVPLDDPRFNHIQDIKDVTPHILDEIANFLLTYKILQKKEVKVGTWQNVEVAKKMVTDSMEMYAKK